MWILEFIVKELGMLLLVLAIGTSVQLAAIGVRLLWARWRQRKR